MNLTYEVNGNGYTIFNHGVAWIVQDGYIPYPTETVADSAQLHINEILAAHKAEPAPTEIDLLRQELVDTK